MRVKLNRRPFSGVPRSFTDPANRYVARYATPWRRAVAAAIDWALCYVIFLLASLPFGMVQAVGNASREAGDLGGVPGHVAQVAAQVLIVASVVAYWVVMLPTSHTFGMRIMDIRIVSTRTGRGLSYLVAALRGAVATVMAAAFYAAYLDRTAYDDRPTDDTSLLLLDVAYVLVAGGCLSALVMVVTPRHRSILDRVFGTAVLDEFEATEPHLGPWGPVDAFDTSNRRVRLDV